jgi:pimeloyl-ACP methyl ester carboxylesterase
LIEERDLRDVTLVGFSMGGGEVARYVANHGQERLHSGVRCGGAAVPAAQ